MSISYSEVFPVHITNAKTGKSYVAGSLAASSAYTGTLLSTIGGTLGGIPYAMESALTAPKGERFRHAVAGLKTEGLASARVYGALGVGLPIGVYIGEKMGLKNRIAKNAVGVTSAMVLAWGLLLRRSTAWRPNGSIISVVSSTVFFIGGLNVILYSIPSMGPFSVHIAT